MNESLILEIAMSILGGLFTLTWWFYRQRDQDRKEDIKGMGERIQKAEELITEIRLNYTKAEDFEKFTEKIFAKLDEITSILHNKADKQ